MIKINPNCLHHAEVGGEKFDQISKVSEVSLKKTRQDILCHVLAGQMK